MSEADELWHVRVHWTAEPGATCMPYDEHIVSGESRAVDAAVSVLDSCCHPWAPVRATLAEVRRQGSEGPWRRVVGSVSAAFARSYI